MYKVLLATLAIGLMSSICVTAHAGEAERPFIWVKTSDRTDILEKIENEPWANYVNKASGIAFKGRFAVVTLDVDGNWTEAYIGNGHHLNYKDLTLYADEHSHAAYLKKL